MTETDPDDRVVASGASIAETPDVPAGRTADPVGFAAIDANIAVNVVVIHDPAPLPATSRGRLVDNHATPSFLPDSRVGPPPVDNDSSFGTLFISL